MKKLFFAVMVGLFLASFMPKIAAAGCLATPDQVKAAQAAKADAVKAREHGDLVTAAAKFQEAAGLHPQEVYKALYLLNAEGCLVGKWNAVKGYRIVATKATANHDAAQAILDQVKNLVAEVGAEGCDYDGDPLGLATNWLQNAQDALNGVYH